MWGAGAACEERLELLSAGPDASAPTGLDAADLPDAEPLTGDAEAAGGGTEDAGGGAEDAGIALPEPLLLYTFDEGSGSLVRDRGPGAKDLVIADPANVTWLSGALRIDAPTVLATRASMADVAGACQQTDSVTVEAWLTPSEASVVGLRHIVAFSEASDAHNFVLAQGGGDVALDTYAFALRTTSTGTAGAPLLRTDAGRARTALTHVVVVHRDNTNERIWVDGEERAFGKRTGSLSPWDGSFGLQLVNQPDATGDEAAWLGSLHLVAIYCRAIADHHAKALFVLGPER